MKHLFSFLLTLGVLALSPARAEESSALRWHSRLVSSAADAGDTVELVVTAEIDAHALIYSSDFNSDIGPQPTKFDFSGSDGIKLIGTVRSVEPKRKKDRTWDVELGYFENRAEFRQTVRILRKDFVLRGTVNGQLCNEKEGTCALFTHPVTLTADSVLKQK